MKKATKIIASVAAVAVAGGVATALVNAWGDNAGGRTTYTVADINAGKLGNKIVFNSIKDSNDNLSQKNKDAGVVLPLTDERQFVGARVDDGTNAGKNNQWYTTSINVEEGKTYLVRLYYHNNNPNGEKAVAKDVTTSFSLGTVVSTEQRVDGYITSSNATPSKYWDSVSFKSTDGRKFYLDYVEGSAYLENNGVAVKGLTLSDSIVTSGVKVGYSALDGNVPGCYKYAGYVTIKVKPVFESSEIEKTVRSVTNNDTKFAENVTAKIGDTVEYQIKYTNKNATSVKNVIISDSLPAGMTYVKGSTVLYNANHKAGAKVNDDTIVTDGINIGDYAVNANAYVRFRATVTDNKLVCGTNRIVNWAKATNAVGTTTNVKAFAVQDSADVIVEKECKQVEPETCDGVGLWKGNKYPKGDSRCVEQKEPETCDGVGIYKGNKYPKGDSRCSAQTEPKTCKGVGAYAGNTYTEGDVRCKEQEEPKTCEGVGAYKGNIYPEGDVRCTEKEEPKTCEGVGVYQGNVYAEGDSRCVAQTEPETCEGKGVYAGNTYAKGDSRCEDKFVEPVKTLPNTGVASIAASGVIGLGSIITAGGYYVNSRKQLKK